jgi:hypothetical protein
MWQVNIVADARLAEPGLPFGGKSLIIHRIKNNVHPGHDNYWLPGLYDPRQYWVQTATATVDRDSRTITIRSLARFWNDGNVQDS